MSYSSIFSPNTLDHAQSRYPTWRDAVRDMVGNIARGQPDTVNKMAHGKQNGAGSKVTFGLELPKTCACTSHYSIRRNLLNYRSHSRLQH